MVRDNPTLRGDDLLRAIRKAEEDVVLENNSLKERQVSRGEGVKGEGVKGGFPLIFLLRLMPPPACRLPDDAPLRLRPLPLLRSSL